MPYAMSRTTALLKIESNWLSQSNQATLHTMSEKPRMPLTEMKILSSIPTTRNQDGGLLSSRRVP